MRWFINLFKKRAKDVSSSNDISEFFDFYDQIKSDIDYLEKRYETIILKSLEEDFVLNKENFYNYKHGSKGPFYWANSSSYRNSYEIELTKISQEMVKTYNSGYLPMVKKIVLRVKHNGKLNHGFSLESIKAEINDFTIILPNDKFRNILLKYLIVNSIGSGKERLKNVKESFGLLTDILGKDLCRDAKIDDILK